MILEKDKTLLNIEPIVFYEYLSKINENAKAGDASGVLQMTSNLWHATSQQSRAHVREEELSKLVK